MSTNGSPNDAHGARQRQWLFLGLLCVVYAIAAFVADGLHQPLFKDEKHFWLTVELFQGYGFPPSVTELRSYPEVLTPLSFMAWSQLASLTGGGIFSGRLLNLLLSFVVVCIIALRRRPDNTALLAGVGLLLYPYTLPLSVHLYTDVPGVFLVVVGTAFYAHRLPIVGSLFFVLAIATRQYMLAVPAALAAWAFIEWLRGNQRKIGFWLAPAAAAATMTLWLLIFGGLGPAAGIDKWVPPVPGAHAGSLQLHPGIRPLLPYGDWSLLCRSRVLSLPALAKLSPGTDSSLTGDRSSPSHRIRDLPAHDIPGPDGRTRPGSPTLRPE